MVADGESLDVGVRIGAKSSLSVEEHMEQRSPLSSSEPTPGSGEPQTPGLTLTGSPPESDVGVRVMEYRICHNLKKIAFQLLRA
jgi:hypothetical protein